MSPKKSGLKGFARVVVSIVAIGYVALVFYAGWRAIGGDQAALEFLKAFWSASGLTAVLAALGGSMFSEEIEGVLKRWAGIPGSRVAG
jgi:hypothetical protein